VGVILSDRKYAIQEISQIDRILAKFQGIGPIKAAQLRAESDRLEAFTPKTPEFAYLLCKSVSYENRLNMVHALWDVVYADGTLKDVEAHVMDVTQNHLGIRPEDWAAAQTRAQEAAHLST